MAIAGRLPPAEAHCATAHTIRHHVLHPGNKLWLGKRTGLSGPDEREAEDFASGLLVDPGEARLGVGADFLDPAEWDLAEYFGVPEEVVRRPGRRF